MRRLLQGSVGFWLVIMPALFLVTVPGTALAQVSDALRTKAASEAASLLTRAEQGEVRVIVTLRGATSGSTGSSSSSSTAQPSAAMTAGPLGDGQPATVEQSALIATHIGTDASKRQRWATRIIPGTPYVAMTVNAAELENLAADPNVVKIHEDGILRPGLQDSTPLVGMPAAFTFGATGASRMVAIFDTGVEYGHVFVSPRVTNATCFSTTNASFTTLCPNGQPTQIGGSAGQNCGVAGCNHGTHVAGIAAGGRASGTPLNGVARSASIMAVQVFSRRNSDNALTAFDSDILAALNDLRTRVSSGGELANRGVRAVNMSIWDGGFQVAGNCDADVRATPFKTVIDQLLALNVATVIISGNNFERNLSAFPGCVSTAITVSSTTKADAVSDFSNVSTIVDLFAPGDSIQSSINPTPNFGFLSGTSMAAPHVAGAFAAISSACPAATAGEIEAALESTGVLVTDTRSSGIWTKPRIRVNLAALRICGPRNDLAIDFGADGLWQFFNNSAGFKIHAGSPLQLATGDLDGNRKDEVIGVYSTGLWVRYDNGTWLRFSVAQPLRVVTADLDNNGQDELVASYSGLGLFARINNAAAWTMLHAAVPQSLAAGEIDANDNDDVLGIYSTGLWVRFDNNTWRQLNTMRPLHALAADLDGNGQDDVVADFTSIGLFALMNNGASWTKLHSLTTSGLAAGDIDGNGRSDLLGLYNSGFWARYDDGTWLKLHSTRPVQLTIADLDSNRTDDVVAGFAGLGLYRRLNNNPTWILLNPQPSQGLAPGRFD